MSNAESRRTAIALFRYTLILPLLRGEYPSRGKDKLRQQIAARRHDIPHSSRRTISAVTLARWERVYRKHGFDGLKPKPRCDRSQPRTISYHKSCIVRIRRQGICGRVVNNNVFRYLGVVQKQLRTLGRVFPAKTAKLKMDDS